VSDVLRDEFLNVCGKLLVVCDELGVYCCMSLSGTALRRCCSDGRWGFLNVKGEFYGVRG
jgi:hypothetical protein